MNSNSNSNVDKNVLIASAILLGGFFLLTNRKIKQLEREIKKIESSGGGTSGGGGGGTSLANTLLAGNSAGSSNINMNQQKIQNVSELNSNGNMLIENSSTDNNTELVLRVTDDETAKIVMKKMNLNNGDIDVLSTGTIYLGEKSSVSGNEASIQVIQGSQLIQLEAGVGGPKVDVDGTNTVINLQTIDQTIKLGQFNDPLDPSSLGGILIENLDTSATLGNIVMKTTDNSITMVNDSTSTSTLELKSVSSSISIDGSAGSLTLSGFPTETGLSGGAVTFDAANTFTVNNWLNVNIGGTPAWIPYSITDPNP